MAATNQDGYSNTMAFGVVAFMLIES